MVNKWLILILVFGLTGCMTTRPKNGQTINQLQIRVIDLEKQMEQRDKELVDLKYQVKDLQAQIDFQEPSLPVSSYTTDAKDSISTTSSSFSVEDRYDEIIRVDVDSKSIQQALKSAGFYTGSIDGKVGPMTKRAISEFQMTHDLETDGIVGQQTWMQLKGYLSE